jgi:hypothetical protein
MWSTFISPIRESCTPKHTQGESSIHHFSMRISCESILRLRILSNRLFLILFFLSLHFFFTFDVCRGLFGVYGETDHAELAGNLTQVLATELVKLATVNPEELQRAKNQLKASYLSNVEHRHVSLDDMGRQVLAMGHRYSPADVIKNVSVTQHSPPPFSVLRSNITVF